MANSKQIKNQKKLEIIALKKSINLDKGQIVVSKYFDVLLREINNINKSSKIFDIF